eukprot:523791-Pelagomonas_calceolata.AAC.1
MRSKLCDEKSRLVFLAKVGALCCACCASQMLFKIPAPWKERDFMGPRRRVNTGGLQQAWLLLVMSR